MTETSFVMSELNNTLKNIHSWSKPKSVRPSLLNFPSSAKIYKEPYGTVLILSPWNYPFQLALLPVIGAVAAGNTVVLKPSELTSKTSQLLKEIIETAFDQSHVSIVEGGITIAQELLTYRWDYIFFTGSIRVGKIIAKAAAKHLTPVTLELGGKSPCIVDQTASIKLAAKRIVWGKCINGGQTCIAPDYLLIHTTIKEEFITYFKEEIIRAYGQNPALSEDFPRIINESHFDRLISLLEGQNCIFGGHNKRIDRYIAPTLIDEPSLDSPIMKEEIFGPILPLISYDKDEELLTILSKFEKPLAFYLFSNRKKYANKLIKHFSFGGGTINDTAIHFANKKLPFGGVGESGIGGYHGKQTFDTFTHQKGIVRKGTWLDIPTRYAPYKGKLKQLKTLMKLD